MPREDLIPTLKTVDRGGKQHQQVYWKRPAELQEKLQKDGFKAAVYDAGGRGDFAQSMFRAWVKSPGSTGSAALRAAAAKMAFGNDEEAIREELEDYKLAAKYHFKDNYIDEIRSEGRMELASMYEDGRRDLRADLIESRAFTDEKYVDDLIKKDYREAVNTAVATNLNKHVQPRIEAATQDFLDGNERSFRSSLESDVNVSTLVASAAIAQSSYEDDFVTVYRGVKGQQAKELRTFKDVLPPGYFEHPEMKLEIDVDVGVATSFSENVENALQFAGTEGMIITQQVPRSSILATWRQYALGGPIGTGEEEVLVLTKGSMKLKPSDVWKPQNYLEAASTMRERAKQRKLRAEAGLPP